MEQRRSDLTLGDKGDLTSLLRSLCVGIAPDDEAVVHETKP